MFEIFVPKRNGISPSGEYTKSFFLAITYLDVDIRFLVAPGK